MKILAAIFLFIFYLISVCLCLKLMIDAAMPKYKIDNSKQITLGVRDNITKEDITYVSTMCDVYNRRLICY